VDNTLSLYAGIIKKGF